MKNILEKIKKTTTRHTHYHRLRFTDSIDNNQDNRAVSDQFLSRYCESPPFYPLAVSRGVLWVSFVTSGMSCKKLANKDLRVASLMSGASRYRVAPEKAQLYQILTDYQN